MLEVFYDKYDLKTLGKNIMVQRNVPHTKCRMWNWCQTRSGIVRYVTTSVWRGYVATRTC